MSQHYLNDFLGLTSTLYVLSSKVKLAVDTHLVFLQLDTKGIKKKKVQLFACLFFFKASLVLLKFGMLQKMELRMGINTVSIVMYWMQFIWKLFIISFLILLRCGCFLNKIYIYLKEYDLLLQVNTNI